MVIMMVSMQKYKWWITVTKFIKPVALFGVLDIVLTIAYDYLTWVRPEIGAITITGLIFAAHNYLKNKDK